MTLRIRLLTIIGISLVVLWTTVAAWMFFDAQREIQTSMDERLAASAAMVVGLAAQLPINATGGAGTPTAGLDVVARDGLACEVSLLRGEVTSTPVAKTVGSPGLANAPTGYGLSEFGNKRWRTYAVETQGLRVVTADRIDTREKLVRDIAVSGGIPFLVALGGCMPLLWFAIGKGLGPIERIRATLETRRLEDLTPLPDITAPLELVPMVAAIQNLLERVRENVSRQRRFTDDAAHELRTPLTAIKTHLQVAHLAIKKPTDEALLLEALESADQGVLRFQRTLDQLLLLARIDGQVDAMAPEACAAVRASMFAIEDCALTSGECRPSLVVGDACSTVLVRVPESLLVLCLRNLLDNAIRHGRGNRVLRLQRSDDTRTIDFTVVDDGPGLSQQDCVFAVQRFWRRGQTGGGSGLGLPIVQAIALQFDGQLTLRSRTSGGLEATLTFPASKDRA